MSSLIRFSKRICRKIDWTIVEEYAEESKEELVEESSEEPLEESVEESMEAPLESGPISGAKFGNINIGQINKKTPT